MTPMVQLNSGRIVKNPLQLKYKERFTGLVQPETFTRYAAVFMKHYDNPVNRNNWPKSSFAAAEIFLDSYKIPEKLLYQSLRIFNRYLLKTNSIGVPMILIFHDLHEYLVAEKILPEIEPEILLWNFRSY